MTPSQWVSGHWRWLSALLRILAARNLEMYCRGPLFRLRFHPSRKLTGEPAQEYLSDGVAAAMITSLAQVEGGRLQAMTHTSAMSQ